MQNKKTYYSISEVSKMLDIQEHTIRFWDSKIPGLSKQSEKGKTRFFSQQHINKLSNINNLLKNNDSLSMAFKIISKNKISKTNSSNDNENQKLSDLNKNYFNNNKINKIINNLKLLVK